MGVTVVAPAIVVAVATTVAVALQRVLIRSNRAR
jgi:hypothetical protein